MGLGSVTGPQAVLATQSSPTEARVYASPKNLGDGAPAPKPAAEAWLVGSLDDGEVYAQHSPDYRSSPASVQKLLTAVALIDEFEDLAEKYEAQDSDVAVDGTRVGMMSGNAYTIDQLFHAMIMGSANDAAHALGEAVGGQEAALQLMNEKAQELGMADTRAGTTSGLDAKGQGTTVRDLFILAKAYTKNKYLMKISGTTTYMFPGGKDFDRGGKQVPAFQIQNRTQIVGEVKGGLGLKNGYTVKAQGSFVAVAKRGDTTLAAIVLKSANGTRQAAVDLLTWAFNQNGPKAVTEVALTSPPTPTPTAGESTPASAALAPSPAAAGLSTHQSVTGVAVFTVLALVVIGFVTFVLKRHKRPKDRR